MHELILFWAGVALWSFLTTNAALTLINPPSSQLPFELNTLVYPYNQLAIAQYAGFGSSLSHFGDLSGHTTVTRAASGQTVNQLKLPGSLGQVGAYTGTASGAQQAFFNPVNGIDQITSLTYTPANTNPLDVTQTWPGLQIGQLSWNRQFTLSTWLQFSDSLFSTAPACSQKTTQYPLLATLSTANRQRFAFFLDNFGCAKRLCLQNQRTTSCYNVPSGWSLSGLAWNVVITVSPTLLAASISAVSLQDSYIPVGNSNPLSILQVQLTEPTFLSDLYLHWVAGIGFWDVYAWSFTAPLAQLQVGIYNTTAFTSFNPCTYRAGNCQAGCQPQVIPGGTSSNVNSFTCTSCNRGWSNLTCNAAVCYSATTGPDRLNLATCSCYGNYYDVTYGQSSQLALRQTVVGAQCTSQCDLSQAFLYYNPSTARYTCVPTNNVTLSQGPCQNGGTYKQNSDGTYFCVCVGIWTGTNCTVNGWVYDLCDQTLYPDICNGGICIPTGNGTASCDCRGTGHTGNNCEVEINVCDTSNPCLQNSICAPTGPNQNACLCQAGRGGVRCDVKEDWCVISDFNPAGGTACKNGGICQNTIPPSAATTCKCPEGYSGSDCSIVNNPCNSTTVSVCQNNAPCTPLSVTDVYCDCLEGFTGDFCETVVNYCDTTVYPVSPCLHNGTCNFAGPGKIFCNCPKGTNGTRCEQVIDHCASQPCQNGGTCNNLPALNTYFCDCGVSLFYGTNCTQYFSVCTANGGMYNPCINGLCQPLADSGSFFCKCFSNFAGQFCESYVPPGSTNQVIATPPATVPVITYPATPSPTTPFDPTAGFPYQTAGNYIIELQLQVNYALLFAAGYASVSQTLQQDALLALNVPTNRTVLLNMSQGTDAAHSQCTIAWLASTDPNANTPNFWYTTLLPQRVQDPNSVLYTKTSLLHLLTSTQQLYPASGAAQAQTSSSSVLAQADPMTVGVIAVTTVGYLLAVTLGSRAVKARLAARQAHKGR